VLERINRELGGNFDLSSFTHRSIYNCDRHRIEMHLISRKHSARVLGHHFSFRPGESIHTENSYKYSFDRLSLSRPWLAGQGAGPTRAACSRFTRWRPPARSKRDDVSSNRHHALSFCSSMISAQRLRLSQETRFPLSGIMPVAKPRPAALASHRDQGKP
jgi:hypothetical protein